MNKILTYLKVLVVPIISFLIIPLIISIFNLFGLQINKIVLVIISTLLMLVSGFLIGRKSLRKGFVSGAILAFIFIMFLIILGLVFKVKFNLARVIYYLIILLSTMLGSIVGINKKKF